MRKLLIIAVTLVLTSLVVASPLVACPFLQGKPACCRKASSHAPRCPLAPTLERCPFYVTEAKIGWAESRGDTQPALAVSSDAQPSAALPVDWLLHRPDRLPGHGRVYLRYRVLRI